MPLHRREPSAAQRIYVSGAGVGRHLGISHLLIAGGETSGAVTARLGITRLRIGAQAAPGVPWAVAASASGGDARTVAVLLKSGNFGCPALFTDAWEVAP